MTHRQVLCLLIDDTKTAKHGMMMEALTKIWDHIVSIHERRGVVQGTQRLVRVGELPKCWHDQASCVTCLFAALAHLTLTRHGLTAIGAPAKQPHQEVLLPKFQTRLATFRTDIQRQQTERIVERIKHAKLRQRLRKLLLAV